MIAAAIALLWGILWTINGMVLAYFILLNASYLVTSLIAFRALRRYSGRLKSIDVQELVAASGAPPITLIAPAYNEEATCVESARSLLGLNYPEFEIIIVNDGSKDRTLQTLIDAYEMQPAPRMPTAELPTARIRATYQSKWHRNLWLIDKENGGKSDALNAGLTFCQTPIFCAMDSDSLLERDALVRVVRPFLEDRRTVAAGGIIRIVNGCTVKAGIVTDIRLPKNLLVRFQVLEYLRAFLAGRVGWDALGATLIISGAFGVFRRSLVAEIGGFAKDTVGEDMELVVRLHRHCIENGIPYRVCFVPDPVAWTEAPSTLRILSRQRDRWQRGLSEVISSHRAMLLNPKYGRLGTWAFPHFYFLEVWGPIIEVGGYISFVASLLLGWATTSYVVAFLSVAVALGIVLSMMAVGLEELTFRRYPRLKDILWLFALAVIENFGYRQLTAFWRIRGAVSFMRKKKGWGDMTRTGFAVAPAKS